MTRERLENTPLAELAALARTAGVEPDNDLGRDELIDLILENLAELRQEREEGNSHSVRVAEAKYEVSEEQLVASPGDGPPLPDRYNETRVVLMVRDPHWAFAYWDIEDQKAQRVKMDAGFEQLVLRVQDLGPGTFFDIPIQWGDWSWYIYLPSQDGEYCLELGYLAGGRFRQLARSEAIRTPREAPQNAEEADELFFGSQPEPLLGLSSALNSAAIPQRILSAMRE